jgi:hypothetical protein
VKPHPEDTLKLIYSQTGAASCIIGGNSMLHLLHGAAAPHLLNGVWRHSLALFRIIFNN